MGFPARVSLFRWTLPCSTMCSFGRRETEPVMEVRSPSKKSPALTESAPDTIRPLLDVYPSVVAPNS